MSFFIFLLIYFYLQSFLYLGSTTQLNDGGGRCLKSRKLFLFTFFGILIIHYIHADQSKILSRSWKSYITSFLSPNQNKNNFLVTIQKKSKNVFFGFYFIWFIITRGLKTLLFVFSFHKLIFVYFLIQKNYLYSKISIEWLIVLQHFLVWFDLLKLGSEVSSIIVDLYKNFIRFVESLDDKTHSQHMHHMMIGCDSVEL